MAWGRREGGARCCERPCVCGAVLAPSTIAGGKGSAQVGICVAAVSSPSKGRAGTYAAGTNDSVCDGRRVTHLAVERRVVVARQDGHLEEVLVAGVAARAQPGRAQAQAQPQVQAQAQAQDGVGAE